MQSRTEPAEAQLPAWRVELNEKVRAIKARRNGQPASSSAISPEEYSQTETGNLNEPAILGQSEGRKPRRNSPPRDDKFFSPEPARRYSDATGDGLAESQQVRSPQKTNNHIVEAALTRVRRASENASRASLPKIEPTRAAQSPAKPSFKIDREATARALEPTPEIVRKPSYETSPLPELSASVEYDREVEDAVITKAVPVASSTHIPATEVDEAGDSYLESAEQYDSAPILPIDEIEPLDYLEAEIRKVDRALNKEFARSEGLSLSTHIATGIVDLLVIAISSSPFLALIVITNGSFTQSKTRVAAALVVALISFFYLALTQSLCGKTFGMMLTNTRVLDAQTLEPPAPSRALLRAAGYFLAAAPFLLGFLWAIVSKNHRGWHDLISGTLVARDF